jgi:beta-lactamase class D
MADQYGGYLFALYLDIRKPEHARARMTIARTILEEVSAR